MARRPVGIQLSGVKDRWAGRAAAARRDLWAALAIIFAGPHRLPAPLDLGALLESAHRKYIACRRKAPAPVPGASPAAPQDTESLATECACLFSGPGRAEVPPYESLYLAPLPQVMQGPALSAVRFYRAHGFLPREDFHDCPDHIAVELEFLAHLSHCEATARLAGEADLAHQYRAAQLRFLATHLGRWAPAFCHLLQERSRLPLFTQAAESLRALVAEEVSAVHPDQPPAEPAGTA